MRSESSALSLHHIKTTIFTVVLVLPCISEPAERTGIGLCQQPFDSPLGVKKRLKIISRLVLPYSSELAERTGIGTTERRPSISSRDNKSRHACVCFLVLPYNSEPAERTGIGTTNAVLRFSVGSKKRLSSQSFWYSRISASTPSVRESGCVNSLSIPSRS